MFKSDSKLKAIVLAVSLAALSLGVQAAGLGKLTVLSPLGQPLQAELEVTATREELTSLSARVASPETFRQMGIEFAPVAAGIRLVLDKRADGQPFLRVVSDRPINDPFLDLLVEMSWSSGRVVREYTFLLDPPVALRMTPDIAAVPEVRAEPAAAPKMPEPRATALIDEKPKSGAEEVAAARRAVEGTAATHVVKQGETLAGIAAGTKPADVNLDQMLVALYSRNKDVFGSGNMNRLRAGKILNIPDAEAARAVGADEARRIVVAQAADFDAYRKKFAAAVAAAEPAREEAARQAVSGRITPRVEEKTPPPPGKDKLEVSRTEATRAQGRIAALEEDLVARDKALKDATGRIAELEKNLSDLKKLAELKSQQGAELQRQAQAAKPALETKKPEPAPAASVVPAAPIVPAPEAPAAKPGEAPVLAPAEKPAPPSADSAKPVPKKPPVAKKPPPPPAPDFIEENPELVFGGGGLLLLLLGYLGLRVWRRKKRPEVGAEPIVRVTEGDLAAGSVFGPASGQRGVDAGASQADFGQTSAVAINADEGVDPVAEADVYMAYGRDTQAEEILLDALKTDPTRYAIHLKLLEIYAARKDLKQFETLAGDLYGQTGGTGPDWETAAFMGHSLDPRNPLYGGIQSEEPVVEEPAAEEPAAEEPAAEDFASTLIVPHPLQEEIPPAAAEPPPPALQPAEETPAAIDFNLDLGMPTEGTTEETPPPPVEEVASLDFDLNFGAQAEPAMPAPADEFPALDIELGLPEPGTGTLPIEAEAEPSISGDEAAIDFNFDLGVEPPETSAAEPVPQAVAEVAAVPDFDFDLGEPASVLTPAPTLAREESSAFPLDLSAISLELGEPGPAQPPAAAAMPDLPEALDIPEALSLDVGAAEPSPVMEPDAAPEEDNPEAATKLELAQAYEEMGDNEGARELLQEVLNEGSTGQREYARARLARL